MADDDFELWLGRIGKDPSFRGSVRRVINLAGGVSRARSQRFTGARIGRGSAVGALLGSTARYAGRRARRVVVKARVVRLAGRGAAAAMAHLRYLQRDGTTREGGRGSLYGADGEGADGKAFLERSAGDRQQFRLILSPEDGAEYEDLKPLVRRWMAQAEKDLGARLDWVAVDHFNTGHPHSHVLVRGKDELGKDLVIARSYLTHGLRERAVEIVNLDLGPRSDREIAAADRKEMAQERFTGIDRRLLRSAGQDRIVAPHHRDPREQSLRAGRIATLARMGLAEPAGRMRWRLDERLEKTLRAMGKRGDIIATLDHVVRKEALEVGIAGLAIYDPADARSGSVVGRVVERGLAEHDDGGAYIVVDGIDGRAHYVDVGTRAGPEQNPVIGATVRVTPAPIDVRDADRLIAAVAEANGGHYSAELHALHDPGASERFIAAHVRRLEAQRRLGGVASRDPNGLWRIGPDHLERALAYERERAGATPVEIAVLADRPIAQLAAHDGITALDEDPDLGDAARLGGGYGRTVSAALARRRQWLEDQALAGRPDAVEVLRRREFVRIASGLAAALGRPCTEPAEGERVHGTYRQSVQAGALRMAVIDDGRSFALVPWRPVLEQRLGCEVSGVMRGRDVSWSFGRQRAGLER
jgi:type IV secretory pathway VirD2 relaxase